MDDGVATHTGIFCQPPFQLYANSKANANVIGANTKQFLLGDKQVGGNTIYYSVII